MVRKIILFAVILLLGFLPVSCVDIFNEELLEQKPEQDLDFDKVFTDYEQYRKFADYAYSYMPAHLGRMWNSLNCAISDEAEGLGVNQSSTVFNNGSWSGATIALDGTPASNAAFELGDMWRRLYAGIRQANMALDYIDKVQNFPSEVVKQQYKGEMLFVRSFLYFELIKRWGGVPIFDKAVELNTDELDLPRSTYDECVDFIVEGCDAAAALLAPINGIENGRATQGAALALKSRTLLYAARPLNNPENDIEKWKKAADAAKAVIDLNRYSLYSDYVNLFFEPVTSEIILNRPRPAINFEQGHTDNSNFLVRFIVPQGYNGWMGTAVTQNFVDLYEDNQGYPIAHPRSNYNPADPYINRDPRFHMTILYNNRFWYDRNMEFQVNGRDWGETYNNPFSYGIAKFWKESHQRYKGTRQYLNYILFRYAEILLNYAEARNEVHGPDAEVRTALTELRARVGQVPVPEEISDTREKMRERIKNERAIEFSFEEHRWYDVISWKEGVKYFNAPITAMRITRSGSTYTYQVYEYENRVFRDYMHRYPIPYQEIYKSQHLEQNPGW